ncbi:MAG: SH3 domain-containing protein [Desulfobacter sp.]|nr:SH3 domain-containing protein [Desulfobacter sp.]WDP84509.1 MAG: SH3 domain-containing protein [Desulfobacter sp.]
MDQSMSVQVKESHIRQRPSFFSPVIIVLAYGQRVTVLSEDNGWVKVSTLRGTGFVHGSALTPRQVILNPGKKDVQMAASSDEYALAGKGFNSQVEGQFRARNPRLDFSAIDRMETYKVSQSQIRQFLIQGKLSPQGGIS